MTAPDSATGEDAPPEVPEETSSEVAEGGERRPAGETRGRRWLSFGVIGQAAIVVGLIGGVVGLVFTFFPGLKPGSGEEPSADLELADVNGRATLREYLSSEGIPVGSLSPAVLRRLGVLSTVRYTSSGLGGDELPLVVALTSRETGDVVCEHTYRVTAGGGAQLTFRSWSPFPVRPRVTGDSYNLHVTLFPPDGKPPALDADDENGIPGVTASGPRVPLDLC